MRKPIRSRTDIVLEMHGLKIWKENGLISKEFFNKKMRSLNRERRKLELIYKKQWDNFKAGKCTSGTSTTISFPRFGG